MNINELMEMLSNKDAINKLGASAGIESDKVEKLIGLGLPTIMKAMDRNAKTNDGAESLMKALKQHEDDDVDDLEKFINKLDKNDGAKMLNHIFSNKNQAVQNNLAQQTGLDTSQVSSMLQQLALLLIGVLGNQQKKQNLDVNNLSSLMNGALKKSGKGGMMDLAEQFLDADKDGSIVDDVGKMLGGFFKKK